MMDAKKQKGKETKKVTVVGFGPRLVATIVDGAMVGFLGFMLAFIIGIIAMFANMISPEQVNGVLELLTVICLLVFAVIYYIGFWTTGGQTMGKTIIGLKVMRTDGTQLSVGRALLRFIGYIVNAGLFSIGFIWGAFDAKRQGWHDKLAGTLVVYEGTEFAATDEVVLVPSDHDRKGWIWVAFWIITALFLPVGALAGLLTVGPFITLSVVTFIRNAF
jgi:uncharacterized RDD family membrane protein YckC